MENKQDLDQNFTAEELLSKLNLPGQTSETSFTKPMVTEVDPSYSKKATDKLKSTMKSSVNKQVAKGETQIKETVIKSIDEYNAQEEVKKLNKGDKEVPNIESEFDIVHKKGNIRLKIHLPKETSVADIDLQLNESELIWESPNYFWRQTFQSLHPNLKAVKIHYSSELNAPKTSFSKSKKTLTIYVTER